MNQFVSKRHTVLKRMLLLLGVLATVGVILVACGGGGAQQATDASATSADGMKGTLALLAGWVGRPPASEVINGITVPPEPAPTLNNSTLAGIDSNKNGVRDDVERVIAKAFGLDARKYSEAFKFAVAEQAAIVNPTPANIAISNKLIACRTLTADELDKATLALLNTPSRSNAYGLTFAGSVLEDCN